MPYEQIHRATAEATRSQNDWAVRWHQHHADTAGGRIRSAVLQWAILHRAAPQIEPQTDRPKRAQRQQVAPVGVNQTVGKAAAPASRVRWWKA